MGPLVAQNGRYVRYQTLYNQPAYDFIVANKYYLRSQLPTVSDAVPSAPAMQFPNGSIAIKAAWLDMTGFTEAQTRRYYTRTAILKDPDSGTCSRVTVGLVGLHVVQKTPSRPQWSWSTYEHVDNVPPARPDGPGTFTFHDGSAAEMPDENPLSLVPLAPQPAKPFNVVRHARTPIHPNTAAMNTRYQRLLKDTVWGRYQLVMTQWSRVPGNQANPVPVTVTGDASTTFPGVGAGSAFANVTLETFDQDARADRMHELPLGSAHAGGLHVVGDRSRLSGGHRSGALGDQTNRQGRWSSSNSEVRARCKWVEQPVLQVRQCGR